MVPVAFSVRRLLDRLPKRLRNIIEVRLFRLTSLRLRWPGPSARPRRLVLNTYCVSPEIPTIAHWADWQLTRYGFTGDPRRQPRLVFVRGIPQDLSTFVRTYLPSVRPETRFVLVTGDCDHTLPAQKDLRYPDSRTAGVVDLIETLRSDSRLVHWYVQNLDTPMAKMSPIPLGYIERDGPALYRRSLERPLRSMPGERPLKVLCAHRVREGPQWEQRRAVTALVADRWSGFVDHHDAIPERRFVETLARYPFVLCVGGGGLDPSPKAWAALMAGTIPIMERNATTAAYAEFPVAYVDAWLPECLDVARLRHWLDVLGPSFADPALRRDVLHRLSMGCWLERVLDGVVDTATRG